MSLKVGTIEELEKEPEKKPKLSRARGGGNNGSNKNRGGGGGGDNRPNEDNFEQKDEFKPDKYRVGMGLILLVVLMTFGGLIGAYVVLATNKSLEWQPFSFFEWKTFSFQILISTFLIVISSFGFEIAKKHLLAGNQNKARNWFFGTGILGAIFIASQVLAWVSLVNQGYYAQGNPYAGLFYILTGVHAVHVLGGIISLGFIILKTQIETQDEEELLKRQWFAKVVAWYWHFIGVLWLILFLLLGFYK